MNFGKSILQVPDTGTWVLDNTRPFIRSGIVSFWITPAGSKECKYHIFKQYWYTWNVLVFTNTGMFQYLGHEVYFFLNFLYFSWNLFKPINELWIYNDEYQTKYTAFIRVSGLKLWSFGDCNNCNFAEGCSPLAK